MHRPDDQIMSWIDDHRVSWITSSGRARLWIAVVLGIGTVAIGLAMV